MAPRLPPHRIAPLAVLLLGLAHPVRAAGVDENYRIQPGDALVISLLGEPDFGGQRSVGPLGTIQLPIIGTVTVSGKTLAETRDSLVRMLRDVFRDPFVTVALDETACKRRVYVTGRVEKIGSHMLPLGATLLEALVAGGVLEDSDLTAVQVTRDDGQTLSLDMSGLRSGAAVAGDEPVRWDDRLFVSRAEAYVTIVGRVLKPGSYVLPPARKLRVMDLLTQVGGGPAEGADFRTMLLVRAGQAEPERIDLVRMLKQGDMAQNYELRAHDVLVLPETDRIAVAGEVMQPVAFNPAGKVTVLEAVARGGGFTPFAGLRQARVNRADGSSIPVDLDALWRRGEMKDNLDLAPGDVLLVPKADPEEVVITGAVGKAGAYDLRDLKDRSLLRALTISGKTETSDLTRVSLFRGDQHLVCNVRQAMEVGDKANNLDLQPGDVVFVPDNERVLVLGAFGRPGPQAYDAKLTVMDYITIAGGVGQGHTNQGALVRPLPEGKTELHKLDLSRIHQGVLPEQVPVKPGDIIYVPPMAPRTSLWDKLRDFILTFGAIDAIVRR